MYFMLATNLYFMYNYLKLIKEEVLRVEKTRKTLELPTELIKEIEKFQKENYMTTLTSAIIELIRRGLKSTKGRD